MAKPSLALVQAAIAVIERRGRYLISRRPPGAHLAGYWEFPGGKRQVRESWTACLRREVQEETGLSVRSAQRLITLRFSYPDRRVLLQAFRCTVGAGTPHRLDRGQIRWVSKTQLQRVQFPPANRPLVELLSSRKVWSYPPRRAIIDLRRSSHRRTRAWSH